MPPESPLPPLTKKCDQWPSPNFRWCFLHPCYWLLWIGICLLFLIVQLPYPLIRVLGLRLGHLSMRFAKRRVNIARRNLQLCFPDLDAAKRHQLLIESFRSAGMGLMESGMAWFWPDRRIRKWCAIVGGEHIKNIQRNQRGILLIGIHFFSLELGARIFGIHYPGIGVYRPHNNPVMNWLQICGRLRSNKVLVDRKDMRSMVRLLKQREILWYAPDHDYGPRNSVFVPFFAVQQAATTVGTHFLMRKANPAIVLFTPIRHGNGRGYTLLIQPPLAEFPLDSPLASAQRMNQAIEQEILRIPEQYMWLHRRFKTRPPGEKPLY